MDGFEYPTFYAHFDNGVIMEWYGTQTWRHVFNNFKLFAESEHTHGTLYAGTTKIRETGIPTVHEIFFRLTGIKKGC